MCRSEELMKRATNVPRDELMSMGTCFGKFNRNGKFRLAITSLEYISQFAKVALTALTSRRSRPPTFVRHLCGCSTRCG